MSGWFDQPSELGSPHLESNVSRLYLCLWMEMMKKVKVASVMLSPPLSRLLWAPTYQNRPLYRVFSWSMTWATAFNSFYSQNPMESKLMFIFSLYLSPYPQVIEHDNRKWTINIGDIPIQSSIYMWFHGISPLSSHVFFLVFSTRLPGHQDDQGSRRPWSNPQLRPCWADYRPNPGCRDPRILMRRKWWNYVDLILSEEMVG